MAGSKSINHLPEELCKEFHDMQLEIAKSSEGSFGLKRNQKRWLLVGIGLHTIISPALRKYVELRLDQLWQTLRTSHNIDIQLYPNHLKGYNSRFLNYEIINNNKSLGRSQQSRYNYQVNNAVDLSKLFLERSMTQYLAFNDSCDLSALLSIIINTGICPPIVTACAEKVRLEIRNRWAHCDFTEWTEHKYVECLDLMKRLVQIIGFSAEEETDLLEQLHKWNQNGEKYIDGTIPECVALIEIKKHVKYLVQCVKSLTDTPAQIYKVQTELVIIDQTLHHHTDKIEQLRKDIKDIKESVKVLCREKAEEEMKIKDKRRVHILEWENDEINFVITKATEFVAKLIHGNNVVVVTGSCGTGKSSLIHHIALELEKKEGYEIIPYVTCPEDIKRHRDMSKNQVFVIDDLCGKIFINDQKLQNWMEEENDVMKYFKNDDEHINDAYEDKRPGVMKILVSCRLQIFKDTKFKSLKMFTKVSCNLESNDYCLNRKERRIMIKKYANLSKPDMKQIKRMLMYPYLPLICRMSQYKGVKEIVHILSTPIEAIYEDIKSVIEINSFEFCALVLCVMFNEGFKEEYFIPEHTPQSIRSALEEICCEFDINLRKENHRNRLINTFNRLEGTYIKKCLSHFTIIHDKLYDIIVACCGRKLLNLFINFSPSKIIAEKFRLRSVYSENVAKHDTEQGLYLYIPEKGAFHDRSVVQKLTDEAEWCYFKRLFRDLENQDGISFFHNSQLQKKNI